jgi:hypothetical protein
MSANITSVTRETCAAYRRALAAGEYPCDIVGYLARQYGVQRPAIWRRLVSGGERPSYGTRGPSGRKSAGIMRDRELRPNAPPPVDRDPCQRCGVRHDIGCKHSRAPVGMTF